MTQPGYDVIAAEVHRKALENITNEMAITLLRTSGSPVVVDAKDFSTCLMDTTPEHLGFAAYVLLHLGTSLLGTRAIDETVRVSGELRPGDGFIVNDPHDGGAAHQGDVAVIMPMFHSGEHLGWGFANMHLLDVGGSGVSGLAPAAHDVYAEGLRFPAVRAIRNGAIDPEWEHLISANVRAPGPVLNDLRSMIAANNVGNRKLAELIESLGLSRYRDYCAINKDISEQVLRERISRIPDGVYEAVEWNEFDGHDGPDQLLEMRVELEVDGSDLRFGFSGAEQIDGFVNAGKGAMYGNLISAVLTTLAYGDLPVNGGIWRPIHVDLGRPGTIVHPTPPAPVSDGHAEVGFRACKLTKAVLSQALALSDDPVLRGRVAGEAQDSSTVVTLFGSNQHGGTSVIIYLDPVVGIGGGAQSVGDGQDGYGDTCMTGCGMPDVESHEAEDPVLFLWREVVPNSGGPGRFRGGQAVQQAFSMAYVDQMSGPSLNGCAEVPPSGFGGGFPAAASTYHLVRASNVPSLLARGELPLRERLDGQKEALRSKVGHMTVHRDDVVVVVGGGGGGLGDPLLREATDVARDTRAGYITRDHADAAYGVVLDESLAVDDEATRRRREEVRQWRLGATPRLELKDCQSPGVSVLRSEDEWRCGSCQEFLGSAEENWRTQARLVETEIAERFAQLHMFVKPRQEQPRVMMREYYCKACAAALTVDVVTEGTEPLAAPRARAAAALGV
jgi:N-methylhydantoinase B